MRRLALGSGFAGSFFTGVLAAVVATPCTAPFMATAIGFALVQPADVALTVMLALGLGLGAAVPGAHLRPGAIGRLPRPGAWMETLKQVLAFPVYATVAWLVWVLAQQVSPAGSVRGIDRPRAGGAGGLVVQRGADGGADMGPAARTRHGCRVADRRVGAHRRARPRRARRCAADERRRPATSPSPRRASASCWRQTVPCSST